MIALALAAVPAAPAQTPTPTPNPALVRIFVKTADGGQASELAARRESVKDLEDALQSKRKTIAVVDREDSADLVLEVLTRGVTVPKVVLGLGPRPNEPPTIPTPVRVAVLRTQLTFGREVLEFTNKNKPPEAARGWESAADDISDQVDKWAVGHRAEILKRRGGDAVLTTVAAAAALWRKIPTR